MLAYLGTTNVCGQVGVEVWATAFFEAAIGPRAVLAQGNLRSNRPMFNNLRLANARTSS